MTTVAHHLWTVPEAARALDVNIGTVQSWIKKGIVGTARRGRGRGSQHMLDGLDVLSIALARDARKRGLSLEAAGNLCNWLRERTIEKLKDEFAQNRRFLMVVGDEVSSNLATLEALHDNPDVDFHAVMLLGMPAGVVDIQGAYEKIEAWLANDRADAAGDDAP